MPKPFFAIPFIRLLPAIALGLLAACSGDDQTAQQTEAADDGRFFIAQDASPGRDMLASMIDPLFNGDLPGQSRALVIMQGGKIVAERYADGFDADTPLIGWSLSKSVTAVLIGILVTDGRLALDEPAPVPAWSSPGDPRRHITLRQLLHMSSGLSHEEGLEAATDIPVYEGDTARMLYLDGAEDMSQYAERRPLEAEPGSHFEYSTPTSIILSDIIAGALTRSQNPDIRRQRVLQFIEGRLIQPLGLDSMTPEFDARGTMVGGAYIHATARDWAKFAEFLRNNGSVAGAQIVPSTWLRFMKAPAPTNAAYGGHIWRNVPRTDGGEQLLFPGLAPDNLIAGLGHYGQFMLVSPDQRLVIVRLGMNETGDLPEITQHLGRLVALFPKRR